MSKSSEESLIFEAVVEGKKVSQVQRKLFSTRERAEAKLEQWKKEETIFHMKWLYGHDVLGDEWGRVGGVTLLSNNKHHAFRKMVVGDFIDWLKDESTSSADDVMYWPSYRRGEGRIYTIGQLVQLLNLEQKFIGLSPKDRESHWKEAVACYEQIETREGNWRFCIYTHHVDESD